MSILHIIKSPTDPRPLQLARQHAAEQPVSVLLLHSAVCRRDTDGLTVYACAEDLAAHGLHRADIRPVDYNGILDLLASHERVINW